MELFTSETLIALATLTGMEIVLGIDNIVFIAILVSRLPTEEREFGRKLGIGLALISRLLLLFSLSWLMRLSDPWFSIFGHGFSGRDMILLVGGLFLIAKATREIHLKVEGEEELEGLHGAQKRVSLKSIMIQIMFVDVIFSLDSVITAVGMANQLWVMAVSVVLAVLVMLVASGAISEFVLRNPTIKILALSFLLLIGVLLLFEGMGGHLNKGYIYFAMFFSLGVELLNMRYRKRRALRS